MSDERRSLKLVVDMMSRRRDEAQVLEKFGHTREAEVRLQDIQELRRLYATIEEEQQIPAKEPA